RSPPPCLRPPWAARLAGALARRRHRDSRRRARRRRAAAGTQPDALRHRARTARRGRHHPGRGIRPDGAAARACAPRAALATHRPHRRGRLASRSPALARPERGRARATDTLRPLTIHSTSEPGADLAGLTWEIPSMHERKKLSDILLLNS